MCAGMRQERLFRLVFAYSMILAVVFPGQVFVRPGGVILGIEIDDMVLARILAGALLSVTGLIYRGRGDDPAAAPKFILPAYMYIGHAPLLPHYTTHISS